MNHDFDLFVIGAGSGGVRAARVAAQLGARVGICEERYYGGTCVNVGCVPKKLMVLGSHFGQEARDAAAFGWNVGEVSVEWGRLVRNRNAEVARLEGIYRTVLDRAGVTRLWGRGRMVGPHRVQVGDRKVTASHVLIATGGRPMELPIAGGERALSSDDFFGLTEQPMRVVIVGGGYIGIEFAGILHSYGSKVCIVHRGELPLSGFDHDVRSHLVEEMRRKGIDVHLRCTVDRIEPHGARFAVHATDQATFDADAVIAAVGRRPNTGGIGLFELGVRADRHGAIAVDHQLRTDVPHIFAVGDCIDRPLRLTPVALAEGTMVARRLFDQTAPEIDYRNIPTAVFSQPPISVAGLTEHQARQEVGQVRIFRSTFRPLKNTVSGNEERTLMKLVVDARTDKLLGVHVVGPDAAEMVQGFAVALTCGATKAQLDATIGIHPTAAEELVTMRTPVDA